MVTDHEDSESGRDWGVVSKVKRRYEGLRMDPLSKYQIRKGDVTHDLRDNCSLGSHGGNGSFKPYLVED